MNLNDVNGPLTNGDITGAAADCTTVTPLDEGAPGTDAAIKYVGRFDLSNPAQPHFDWSGNMMNARFSGTQVTWSALSDVEIIYEVIIDGTESSVVLGGRTAMNPPVDQPDSAGHGVHIENNVVTVNVVAGVHEITVVRTSEALFSDCAFVPFTFDASTTLLPPTIHPRRIEMIGDSITCGYGDLGNDATCPYDVALYTETDPDTNKLTTITIPKSEDIYQAYGSISGRRLAADVQTICFSGKGVSVNYREQGIGEGKVINPNDDADPDAKTVIPDYYLRTLATIGAALECKTDNDCPSQAVGSCDSGICRCQTSADCCAAKDDAACVASNNACEPAPIDTAGTGNTCHNDKYMPWDFTKDLPMPQVVFINLGTNDFSRDLDQNGVADGIDLGLFHDKYLAFVQFVRSKRPDAQIILAVPPMLTDEFPLTNARTNMKSTLDTIVSESAAAGDNKVYEMQLVEMGVRYGLGCDYHPNLVVHQIMADQMVGAIKTKTCWSEVANP